MCGKAAENGGTFITHFVSRTNISIAAYKVLMFIAIADRVVKSSFARTATTTKDVTGDFKS
jgi:hypothetical protein